MRFQWIVFFVLSTMTAHAESSRPAISDIEGAYDLISDTLVVGTLDKKTVVRDKTAWTGIWIFNEGFYSQTTMKKGRSSWVSTFPRDGRALGYLSSAGSYVVDDKYLVLRETVSLFPESVSRPGHYEFRVDGDALTLRESWQTSVERALPGERIIVLKRLRLPKEKSTAK